MAGSLVDRATSDHLIGPDWAMNMEICDICNRQPGQAKDVVKALKKRVGHRNPKVQLLALTLLETVVKNCGDIVHMHVTEKDILYDMVKIVKKKPDPFVREKILSLVDIWQESFGGPRARYPQYFAAYHELVRAGAQFPKRSESAAPLFTPQNQLSKSIPTSLRSTDNKQGDPASSAGSDFPAMSLTEIHNARGIMDVLAEMLNALDPGNREGLRQEVIVELVDQCRNYKQKLVHLINSTSDEELLSQGLALNDDLQNVLAKHDAIAAGIAVRVEKKPKSLQALVDIEDSNLKQGSNGSTTASEQPLVQDLVPLSAPQPLDSSSSKTKRHPDVDLLSGWDDNNSTNQNSLSLVPIDGSPLPDIGSTHNALVLFDMLSQPNPDNGNSKVADTFSSMTINSTPELAAFGNTSQLPTQPQQLQERILNGALSYDKGLHLNNTSVGWNGQIAQGPQIQQPPALHYDDQSGVLLPPPWEVQPTVGDERHTGNLHSMPRQLAPSGQLGSSMPLQSSQPAGPGLPQPQAIHPSLSGTVQPFSMQQVAAGFSSQMQLPSAYGTSQYGGQFGVLPNQPMPGGLYSVGNYPQVQGAQFINVYPHSMYGGGSTMMPYGYKQPVPQQQQGYSNLNDFSQNGSLAAMTPLPQPARPSKLEDKLFGDLVSLAKSKPGKAT